MELDRMHIFWIGAILLTLAIFWFVFLIRRGRKDMLLQHMNKFMQPLADELKALGYNDYQIKLKVVWAYEQADHKTIYPAGLLRDHIAWLKEHPEYLKTDLLKHLND